MGRIISVAKAVAFGAVGGALFALANIPLAWMLGSLFASGLGGRFLGPAHVPRVLRDALVPVLGVLLGSAFNPAILDDLARWPAGFAVVAAFVVAITGLGVIYFIYVAKFDKVTACFAALPGGLSDLTLVGAGLGADLGRLALIHAMRVLLVVTMVPLALGWLGYAGSRGSGVSLVAMDMPSALALVTCASVGYGLGRVLRAPAPAIIGPLLVSAGLHMTGLVTIVPPGWLVIIAQIVLGAFIGSRLATMHGRSLRSAIMHGILWGGLIVLAGAGFAVLAAPLAKMPVASILLGLAPGGLPEMAVLTLALGVDVAFVATSHLLRLILVYTFTSITVGLGAWRR